MRRLTNIVKRRIVEHLACYHSPTEVAQLIKEEFVSDVPARHVRAYDPTSYQCTASQRWIDLHRAYRERFRLEISAIPITHRAFRMRRLQQAFGAAWDSGNSVLMLKLLEQAAKEMGNWFVR
jgi:hypothetical protein